MVDKNNYALYFSRSPVPWQNALKNSSLLLDHVLHHIGLYAYRAGYVTELASLEPSPLESLESLEQLRSLWYGHKIHVAMACAKSFPGVDTQEDLDYINNIII